MSPKDTKERILQAGKEEFLRSGFQKASLRRIAKTAGVTTGAIYGYYSDKRQLFEALVAPAKRILERDLRCFWVSSLCDQHPNPQLDFLVDEVFNQFDIFKLLVCRAPDASWEAYLDHIAEQGADQAEKELTLFENSGWSLGPKLLRFLSSTYYTALFDIVRHDMSQEEAKAYTSQLERFFLAGWRGLLKLAPSNNVS